MRKTMAIILAVILALGLAACGGNNQQATQQPQQDTDSADLVDDGTDNAADAGDEDDDYGLMETEEGYYQEFDFYNSTEQTIVEMYASAGGANQWGDNMLDGAQIGPDQTTTLTIYINPGDATDFRVVAENGAEHELRGYELENFTTLELVANEDGTATVLLS